MAGGLSAVRRQRGPVARLQRGSGPSARERRTRLHRVLPPAQIAKSHTFRTQSPGDFRMYARIRAVTKLSDNLVEDADRILQAALLGPLRGRKYEALCIPQLMNAGIRGELGRLSRRRDGSPSISRVNGREVFPMGEESSGSRQRLAPPLIGLQVNPPRVTAVLLGSGRCSRRGWSGCRSGGRVAEPMLLVLTPGRVRSCRG